MIEIGERILRRRLELGLSQLELSKRSGVPRPNISNIEKGKHDPTVSTVSRLAYALEVSLSELFQAAAPTKRLELTRERIERLAEAVVRPSPQKHLSDEERTVVELFKDLLGKGKGRWPGLRKGMRAEFELRNYFTRDEIKSITYRIRDAEMRPS